MAFCSRSALFKFCLGGENFVEGSFSFTVGEWVELFVLLWPEFCIPCLSPTVKAILFRQKGLVHSPPQSDQPVGERGRCTDSPFS